MNNHKLRQSLLLISAVVVLASIILFITSIGFEKDNSHKIGLIITGQTTDNGWNGVHYNGVVSACEKLGVKPTNILIGIASGLFFEFEGDDASKEVAEYTRVNGVFKALSTYSGIDENSNIAKTVNEYYEKIKNKTPINQLI